LVVPANLRDLSRTLIAQGDDPTSEGASAEATRRGITPNPRGPSLNLVEHFIAKLPMFAALHNTEEHPENASRSASLRKGTPSR